MVKLWMPVRTFECFGILATELSKKKLLAERRPRNQGSVQRKGGKEVIMKMVGGVKGFHGLRLYVL
jgi:hypothetical protein